MLVEALTSISSPSPMPAAATARCSAVVPLVTAIPYLQPTKAAKRSSNSGIATPNEPEISPRRSAATTAAISASPTSGSWTGIRSANIYLIQFIAEERPLLDGHALHVLDHAHRMDAVHEGDGIARAQRDCVKLSAVI